MHGPLNYYRTTEARYKEELGTTFSVSKIFLVLIHILEANLDSKLPDDLPVLLLRGTLDTVTTSLIDRAKGFIKLYNVVTLEGRGHWLMIEDKEVVTNRIINWLDGLTILSQNSAKL